MVLAQTILHKLILHQHSQYKEENFLAYIDRVINFLTTNSVRQLAPVFPTTHKTGLLHI